MSSSNTFYIHVLKNFTMRHQINIYNIDRTRNTKGYDWLNKYNFFSI